MKTPTAACILFLIATRLGAAEPPAPPLNAAVKRVTSSEAVDEAEASRRIAERRALAPVNAALVQEFGDRYAGRVITRDPLGMTVRLKGAGAVPGRIVATAMGPVQVRFVPGARHSSKDLQQIVASNRLRPYFSRRRRDGRERCRGPHRHWCCGSRHPQGVPRAPGRSGKGAGRPPSFQALCRGAAVAARIREASSRCGSWSSHWQQDGNDPAQNSPAG